jgi:hypothetical protein
VIIWSIVREKPMPSILVSTKITAARTPIVWRKSKNEIIATISSLHLMKISEIDLK